MPLHMRLPKLKGFKNRFRTEYQVVNLDQHRRAASREGGTIGVDELVAKGAVRDDRLVKVLGGGDLSVALQVTAHAFSASRQGEDRRRRRHRHRAVAPRDPGRRPLPSPAAGRRPARRGVRRPAPSAATPGRDPRPAVTVRPSGRTLSARLPGRRRLQPHLPATRLTTGPAAVLGRRRPPPTRPAHAGRPPGGAVLTAFGRAFKTPGPAPEDPVHARDHRHLPARARSSPARASPTWRSSAACEQVEGESPLRPGQPVQRRCAAAAERSSRSGSCRTSRPRSSCSCSSW